MRKPLASRKEGFPCRVTDLACKRVQPAQLFEPGKVAISGTKRKAVFDGKRGKTSVGYEFAAPGLSVVLIHQSIN